MTAEGLLVGSIVGWPRDREAMGAVGWIRWAGRILAISRNSMNVLLFLVYGTQALHHIRRIGLADLERAT